MQLIPKITYHTDQEIERALNGHGPSHRQQREPFTAVTLSALLELRIAGAGTGTSALTLQSSSFYSLRMAIDADFQSLERSISHLQESLTSLVEVVLQNRRGLDLSFLPRGRGGCLCVALKEECCFYADHSSIVKESLAKVRESLEKDTGPDKDGLDPGLIVIPG